MHLIQYQVEVRIRLWSGRLYLSTNHLIVQPLKVLVKLGSLVLPGEDDAWLNDPPKPYNPVREEFLNQIEYCIRSFCTRTSDSPKEQCQLVEREEHLRVEFLVSVLVDELVQLFPGLLFSLRAQVHADNLSACANALNVKLFYIPIDGHTGYF